MNDSNNPPSTTEPGCSVHERLINRLLGTDLYWTSSSVPNSDQPGQFIDFVCLCSDNTVVALSIKDVRQLANAFAEMANDMEWHLDSLPHLRAAAARNRLVLVKSNDE